MGGGVSWDGFFLAKGGVAGCPKQQTPWFYLLTKNDILNIAYKAKYQSLFWFGVAHPPGLGQNPNIFPYCSCGCPHLAKPLWKCLLCFQVLAPGPFLLLVSPRAVSFEQPVRSLRSWEISWYPVISPSPPGRGCQGSPQDCPHLASSHPRPHQLGCTCRDIIINLVKLNAMTWFWKCFLLRCTLRPQ